MRTRRVHLLWVLGVVEALTFAVLLVNLVTGDDQFVAAAVGLVHGCCYLWSLWIAWTWATDRNRRYRAVVPGIGALLLARSASEAALR